MVRRRSQRERGFTVIELMVVVVIVAILAAVAVPQFFSEAKKVKSNSEVSAMLAELSAKEERYKLEYNSYLAIAECPTPSVNGTDTSTCSTTWSPLGVLASESTLRCGYKVEVGTTADDPTAAFTVSGAAPTNTAPTTTPAQSWYVVQARCDIDGNGVYGYYVTSNLDSRIQKYKEGN